MCSCQPGGEASSGPANDRAVHSVRPGPHRPAQPRSTEGRVAPLNRSGQLAPRRRRRAGPAARRPPVGSTSSAIQADGRPAPRSSGRPSLIAAARDLREQGAHPGGRGPPGGEDLFVIKLVAQARREVGDQRQPQHLASLGTSRDRLEHRRHPDQVGAEHAGHPYLSGRLVLRAWEHRVDAFGDGRVDRLDQGAQPQRVDVGEIDEAGADERGAPGQVEVVADHHRIADRHARTQTATGVGQHDRAASGRCRHAHAVHHSVDAASLVEVRAAEEGEHALRRRRPSERTRPRDRRPPAAGTPGRSVIGDLGDRGAEVGDCRHPARAQHDRYVVAGDAGASASAAAAALALRLAPSCTDRAGHLGRGSGSTLSVQGERKATSGCEPWAIRP